MHFQQYLPVFIALILLLSNTLAFSQENNNAAPGSSQAAKNYLGCGISFAAGDVTVDNTGILVSLIYSHLLNPKTSLDIALRILGYSSSPRLPLSQFQSITSTVSLTGDATVRFEVLQRTFVGGGISIRNWSFTSIPTQSRSPFLTNIAFFQNYDVGGTIIVEYQVPVYTNQLSFYGQAHYFPLKITSVSTVPSGMEFPIPPRMISLGVLFRLGF